MKEFTENHVILEATGVSPFYANYEFNPQFNIEHPSTPSEREKLNAEEFETHMNTIH